MKQMTLDSLVKYMRPTTLAAMMADAKEHNPRTTRSELVRDACQEQGDALVGPVDFAVLVEEAEQDV